MEKNSSGNVHYINPKLKSSKTPEEASYKDLILGLEKRLEKRISGIEKEFTNRIEHIHQSTSQSQKHLPSQVSSQLSMMVSRLEDRIHRISSEIKKVDADSGVSRGSKKLILDGLASLRKFASTSEIKDLLKTIWFGDRDLNYDFDEFGMDPKFKEKVKPLFDFLYYNYWRVSLKGLKNIPSEGPGLIVPNHSGTFPYDGAMIAEGIFNDHPSRRDVRFLVEDFVYHFPFLGTFMYRIGGVRACPENAERLLSKNHIVTVFPEGVKGIGKNYKNRYRLQRFGRGGFIKLALRTNTPIIPTAVIGAEEIHPLFHRSTLLARPLGIPYIPITPTFPLLGPLGLVPLPSKWTIVFGEPIHFSPKYGPEHAEDQLLINRLSETVREKIQDMIVEELKLRRSVWFG